VEGEARQGREGGRGKAWEGGRQSTGERRCGGSERVCKRDSARERQIMSLLVMRARARAVARRERAKSARGSGAVVDV